MQNILINDDFRKSISRLRAILPVLSFTLLIATYLISAVIMGIFHAQRVQPDSDVPTQAANLIYFFQN